MDITVFLYTPAICGLAMALVTWLIFDFLQDIFTNPHKKLPREAIKLVIALLNGVMSYLAEIMTENNASPRTIALYVPIMIVLEVHILGHMKTKWGSFSIFAITSFMFITMFSVSLGITNLIMDQDFLASRYGLVIPVTMTNLILAFILFSIKLYKISLKGNDRNSEIGTLLSDYKSSLILVLFATVNAIAVTVLTYDSIDMLAIAGSNRTLVIDICRNMIIRDSILSSVLVFMLDLQSRSMKSESKTKDMIAKNILLERDIQTQNMVQMGLEAARKELEEKNKKLAITLEYEKRLRSSLRRNILFRFSCNITKGIVEETGALKVDALVNGDKTRFDDIVKFFLELLVHPDFRESLQEKMSIENLKSITYTDRGFNVPIQLSPGAFINYFTLDDDSAKIYAYVDREYIWTDFDCTIVPGDDGDTYAYFYVMDIDEKKQKEDIIQKAANTDALTGLLNRRAFSEKLSNYLSAENNKGGALFMFDLDHFKSVNDNLGHPKGDELLKNVADILNNTFRSDDFICRIGGDEFCAFAKGFTDKSLIIKRAEALNEAGRQSFSIPSGEEIHVSFSIGIAVIPGDADNYKDLYTNADSALYQAKESGRDCYRTFSE